MEHNSSRFPRGEIKGQYNQKSAADRIEALFLDNVGKILSGEQIEQVAQIKRWHQRVSELRTDKGYTVWTNNDLRELQVSEYIMPNSKKRVVTPRVSIADATWNTILQNANSTCEWNHNGEKCPLKRGDIS